MIQPETQYTKVDGSWIGYQVVGDGPTDLLFVSGVASNIETMWDWPAFRRALERMASFSRLILFDPRGAGISDAIPSDREPTWENLAQDVGAVLEASNSKRSALLAQYDGGIAAMLFAASFPDRASALVLWNCYPRSTTSHDYPFGFSSEETEAQWQVMDELWGRSIMIPIVDPSLGDDQDYVRAAAKYLRTASSPGRARSFMEYGLELDARGALSSVRLPTLVMVSHNNYIEVEHGRYLAEHIPGSRLVEFPVGDLNFFAGNAEQFLDEVEEFITGSRRVVAVDRILATVLFTDIVGSTEKASTLGDRRWKELLAEHDRVSRNEIDRFRGRLVTTTGDGILATFDGPGRAIRCAHALGKALASSGVQIRAGLHTGEIELREGDDIGGIAVHIASRVMGEAGPSEVVVSRTVKDLVAGSEFAFDDRGLCVLKGVPDPWQLYVVRQA